MFKFTKDKKAQEVFYGDNPLNEKAVYIEAAGPSLFDAIEEFTAIAYELESEFTLQALNFRMDETDDAYVIGATFTRYKP